jgi:hypothetical protein
LVLWRGQSFGQTASEWAPGLRGNPCPGTFNPYFQPHAPKPIELSPGFARRFAEDTRAYFAETNLIKRDEIAARQLHALGQHYNSKLKLTDVRELFLQMKDHA